jgi:hypothetical protein
MLEISCLLRREQSERMKMTACLVRGLYFLRAVVVLRLSYGRALESAT